MTENRIRMEEDFETNENDEYTHPSFDGFKLLF